jgi:hypothetical protein
MHTAFVVLVFGIAVAANAPTLDAQIGVREPDSVRVLSRQERVDLVNSVLRERMIVFGQSPSIDLCAVAQTIGPGSNPLSELHPDFRARAVGEAGQRCANQPAPQPLGGSPMIRFSTITYEQAEYIPTAVRTSPRPSGLMVVRATVAEAGSVHTEEWVMRLARSGVWSVMTVRLFGFSVS